VKSIYLAGPDVFLPDARQAGDAKKRLCQTYGFEGLFPIDNDVHPGAGESLAFAISRENEALIQRADIIVANLTPFRGPSADAGTLYELGLARGLGKFLAGYTNVATPFSNRTRQMFGGSDEHARTPSELTDRDGLTIEDFGLHDNLMIEGGIHQAGGIFITHQSHDSERYTDLTAFEQVLKHLKNRMDSVAR
tara:strand:- start:14722 stop:15300 length:579 start_codon:yes stop_codon:yes gene_type:complete